MPMESEAVALVMLLGAYGSTMSNLAYVQSSVGGPTKQISVGGAGKQRPSCLRKKVDCP